MAGPIRGRVGPWQSGVVTVADRPEPSGRLLTSQWTPGPLLVDDPGSRYALTADRASLVPLDKFSQRTAVLSADGLATDSGFAGPVTDGAGGDGPLVAGELTASEADDLDKENRAPTPQDDEVVTRVARPKQIDVLANDTDPDGDQLAIVDEELVVRGPGDGSAIVVDNSSIRFDPGSGENGGTQEFEYTVVDPGGKRGTATVTVTVKPADVNTAPVALDDVWPPRTADLDTRIDVVPGVDTVIPVLANDTDAEGDQLTITRVSTPTNGTAAVTESGEISFIADQTGTSTFDYEVADGYGGSDTATVTVEVGTASRNRAPITVPDRLSLKSGTTQTVNVLGNDSDPDGDALRLGPSIDLAGTGADYLTVQVLANFQLSVTADPAAPRDWSRSPIAPLTSRTRPRPERSPST
ncbi:MAG: Ig-like domain-containing protein [Ilumatobacteraceae bacterium]